MKLINQIIFYSVVKNISNRKYFTSINISNMQKEIKTQPSRQQLNTMFLNQYKHFNSITYNCTKSLILSSFYLKFEKNH